MNYMELNSIDRINLMESYLDEVQAILLLIQSENEMEYHSLFTSDLLEKTDILMDYYFNGTWLQDYEADERGEIPKELKRGVLAEDTLYDLYIELKNLGYSK